MIEINSIVPNFSLIGSDKKEQKKVIKQSNNSFNDYCERTNYDPN